MRDWDDRLETRLRGQRVGKGKGGCDEDVVISSVVEMRAAASATDVEDDVAAFCWLVKAWSGFTPSWISRERQLNASLGSLEHDRRRVGEEEREKARWTKGSRDGLLVAS